MASRRTRPLRADHVGVIAVAASAVLASASAAAPAGCPSSPLVRVAAERWAPARATLLPAGVSALRLCRYSSANAARPRTLIHTRLVSSRALIGWLVREFDALPKVPPGVVFHCPSDDGSEIDVLAEYPQHQRVTVIVSLTGCATVTNGTVTRTSVAYGGSPVGPRLLLKLKSLTAR